MFQPCKLHILTLLAVFNKTKLVYLYSFIRLADYLISNTMHVLAVNSVATLLNLFTEQLQATPSLAAIQNWVKVLEAIEDVPEFGEDRPPLV